MALSIPSGSPSVTVREIDLTGRVPVELANVGAYVGNFRWGPVEEATLVSNEAGLVSAFGAPNEATANDFLSAAAYLQYSNALQVVRVVTSAAKNGYDADASGAAITVKNEDDFNIQAATLDENDHTFVAKYPGDIGNSIKVSVCPASGSDSDFTNWTYAAEFPRAPGTSAFVANEGGSSDEVHVAIIDEDGLFTGSKGSVIEKFPFLSVASNAKTSDGSSNYIKDVINNRSRFVWMAGFGSSKFDANAGSVAAAQNYGNDAVGVVDVSIVNGVASGTLTAAEVATGVDVFNDPDTITIDFLIAPGMAASATQITVVNDMIATVDSVAGRRDCVVVTSPARDDVVNSTTPVSSAVTTASSFTSSSYLVVDNNYLKVYDRYNDKYRFIPAAAATAGLMSATATNSAPWFSPAGQRRGRYLGVAGLAYTPTKAERDTLYKAGINPVANIPGAGILLYGDKTFLNRPSAFDRINVRKLFLFLERSIASAAKDILFEFNDEFTRAEFVGIVEPLLREVQGGRGITDFLVVCDETNNTPAVIDRNEFVANIFIKPARSINYITLNFVAVRTGVSFEEVVGAV